MSLETQIDPDFYISQITGSYVNKRENSPKTTEIYVNRVGLDWVRFSLPSAGWPFIRALLDASALTEDWMDGSRYKRKFFTVPIEGVLVAADAMPIHDVLPCDRFTIDFSGNGLAHFFTRHAAWANLYNFFQAVLNQPGIRVNRLDVALDCFQRRQLTVLKAHRYVKRGDVNLRWRHYNLMRSTKGDTLYLGSRQSDSFCRIYDKRAQEMARQGGPDMLPNHWTRLELELKDNTATAVAYKLFAGQFHPATVAGVIRAFIDFLEPDTTATNVSRRPQVGWWRTLLNSAAKVPIRIPKPIITLDKKRQWVEKSVAPTFALLTEAEAGDMAWFYQLIRDGRLRLTREQLALLETVTHGR